MSRERIDITGICKYRLIAALCNGTSPMGMGAMHPKAMELITADDVFEHMDNLVDCDVLRYDYLFGRHLKINILLEDEKLLLDRWWLYDRDAGEGMAMSIVEGLRKKHCNEEA